MNKKQPSIIVIAFAVFVVFFAVLSIAGYPDGKADALPLTPLEFAEAEPVANLGHGLYLVRMTTAVQVQILRKRVVIPQITYVRLNENQLRTVWSRINNAKDTKTEED